MLFQKIVKNNFKPALLKPVYSELFCFIPLEANDLNISHKLAPLTNIDYFRDQTLIFKQ